MEFSKTNELSPKAFVRLQANSRELSGNLQKEWIMNANGFFRCPVALDLVDSRRHSCVVEKAKALLRDDGGATMVEYAFMVMLIAIVCVAAITTIGTKLSTVYNAVANDI
jgi:pilus assembly protein Flp/PilA